MDVEYVLQRLSEGATRLEHLEAPMAAGVYAYFLVDGAELPGVSNPGSSVGSRSASAPWGQPATIAALGLLATPDVGRNSPRLPGEFSTYKQGQGAAARDEDRR